MVRQVLKVSCRFCDSEKVSRNRHNRNGKHIYNGDNHECPHHNFVEHDTYKAYEPAIRKQVLKMAAACSGTRASGRILGISKDSVSVDVTPLGIQY